MPSTSATIGAGSGGIGDGPPGVAPTMVRRPRLLHRLAAARTHRLTVVAGPPGCGKTVALADWAASACPDPVLWLSLDAVDPAGLGPLELWRHLVAGLRRFQVSRGRVGAGLSDAWELLHAGDPDPQELLPLVVAELWRCPPAVVVIDDFHLVTNPAAALFPSLVLDLPPHLHLVLAGREEPAFPLHRLRLGGELVEIADRDLRFDQGEAAALLAGLGVRLPAAELAQLGRAVEGWAVGLHLAGRLLQGEDDPRGAVRHFGGATALVAEYFAREVLDRLPPEHVRFLVDTSVLGELTAGVCAELTGRQDAQAMLQDLAGRNLFLAGAGDGGQAYRYHPLFAGFLQHRLALEGPEAAQGVHRRAAAWFERRGDLGRAVGHLVAGSAPDAALALVAGEVLAHLERGVTWDGASLFLSGVPRAWLEEDPVRLYVAAAALLCGSRPVEARWWLHRLEARLGPGPERAGLLARAAFLWLVHDEAVADAAGVLAHGGVVGEALGPDEVLAPLPGELGRRHGWLGALDGVIAARLPVVLARAHCWRGEHQAARAVLCRVSRRTQVSSGGGYWAVLGTIALAEGRLGEAHTLAQRALSETEGPDAGASTAAYDARVTLGALYLERDELAAAEEQVEAARAIAERRGEPRAVAATQLESARVRRARGEVHAALELLGEVRVQDAWEPLADHLRRRLERQELRCRLDLGDLGAMSVLDGASGEDPALALLAARADLRGGRPDRARARLGGPFPGATTRAEVRRLVLLARAQLQSGEARDAQHTLRQAVEVARPERYIRAFLDEGAQVVSLLEGLAAGLPDPYLAEVLARSPAGRGPVAGATLEPLTGREREILARLTSHLSQHQIAAELYVSLNTVKTHVKGVYRKLGASSRAEAVSAARAHGLL